MSKKTAAQIGDEIAALAARIETAEAALPVHAEERTAALLADDTDAVDRAEASAEAAGKELQRMRERLELLERAKSDAEESERQAAAQALHDRAAAALALAPDLLAEYARAASAVADVMTKLRAIKTFVERANDVAGERCGNLPGVYAQHRFRPAEYGTKYITYWEARDPAASGYWRGEALHSFDPSDCAPRPAAKWFGSHDKDGKPLHVEPTLVKSTETVITEHGERLRDIDDLVELPGVALGDAQMWPPPARKPAEDAEAIVSQLLDKSPVKRRLRALVGS